MGNPANTSPLISKQHGLNSRQYRFCLNILQGMSQTEAYLNAGYVCDSREVAHTCASSLLASTKVSSFLASHQERQLAEIDAQLLSKSEKRQILASIARAQLTEFIDDDGKPVLTRGKASKALKEFYLKERFDRLGNPIKTSSVKLIDPIEAIREDNRMAGHYAPSKHLVAQKIVVEHAPKAKRGENP
uniref:Putative terminase n=1 Tax=viral metagenome TaxID=1070528 RepID=A0A6M3KVN6_9ZZZZ